MELSLHGFKSVTIEKLEKVTRTNFWHYILPSLSY